MDGYWIFINVYFYDWVGCVSSFRIDKMIIEKNVRGIDLICLIGVLRISVIIISKIIRELNKWIIFFLRCICKELW